MDAVFHFHDLLQTLLAVSSGLITNNPGTDTYATVTTGKCDITSINTS